MLSGFGGDDKTRCLGSYHDGKRVFAFFSFFLGCASSLPSCVQLSALHAVLHAFSHIIVFFAHPCRPPNGHSRGPFLGPSSMLDSDSDCQRGQTLPQHPYRFLNWQLNPADELRETQNTSKGLLLQRNRLGYPSLLVLVSQHLSFMQRRHRERKHEVE